MEPQALGRVSRITAFNTLNRLAKKFKSNPAFKKQYSVFIAEYKSMGHMVAANNIEESSSAVFYLPHHGVIQESSSTTKLRVVFNGSSQSSSGLSINSILHAGAKLQTDIAEVLLWSKTHRILFATDMVKMYRQIAVHRDNWDLQRILWYDKENRPVDYQLTTVTYGFSCAPFLALRTIQQLEDEGSRFPKAIVLLTKGRYVDDIFGEAESITETKEIVRQLTQLCQAGQFPLQKWNSNCPEVLPKTDNKSVTLWSLSLSCAKS
ncbi:uncharacterized protein LOC118645585 [Monomorium pharaonis]|uniref:uncharacterized protein LOC118645585 n=1 Tax=Monomorium pharaonis TaxID=307658 RepID=UPI001746D7AC|nr:uncharacterized protein LOC118645585 [Monomorium pharaonis]